MVKLVSGTDVTKQAGLLNTLSEDDVSPIVVMTLLLHAADVSNPAKPFALYIHWTQRVLTEFFLQGDIQRERQVKVSPMCDVNAPIMRKCQLGFIGVVVKPLYSRLNEWINLRPMLERVNENTDYWGDPASEAERLPTLLSMHEEWKMRHSSAAGGCSAAMQVKLNSLYTTLLQLSFPPELRRTGPADTQYDTQQRRSARSRGLNQTTPARFKHDRVVYNYPGVQRSVEPMFSVLKVEKEYMPFESYPVRQIDGSQITVLPANQTTPSPRIVSEMRETHTPRPPDLPLIGKRGTKRGGGGVASGTAGFGSTAGGLGAAFGFVSVGGRGPDGQKESSIVKLHSAVTIETQLHNAVSKILVLQQKRVSVTSQVDLLWQLFGSYEPILNLQSDTLDQLWRNASSKWQLNRKQVRHIDTVWGSWLKARCTAALPQIIQERGH